MNIYRIKKLLNKYVALLLLLMMIMQSVYAATYKVRPTPTSNQTDQSVIDETASYVYTPENNYANTVKPPDVIEFIVDYTWDMYVYDLTKNVKQALFDSMEYLPKTTLTGLRMFGAIKKDDPLYRRTIFTCFTAHLVLPIGMHNGVKFRYAMKNYRQQWMTSGSIIKALKSAIESDMADLPSDKIKKIVLITFGEGDTGYDPCAYFKKLGNERKDIVIDVILMVDDSHFEYTCMTNSTGGKLYQYTNQYNGIYNALVQSMLVARSGTLNSRIDQK